MTNNRSSTAKLTVFTPAYNRANLLPRLYKSLAAQTCHGFEWLVIDDGSTDNTRQLVEGWAKSEKTFRISYVYKENGGLHTAYNEAIADIETPLCVCVDSDDWMPDNAVEIILDYWKVRGSDKVAGIVGLDFTPDGQVIGDLLPDEDTINLIDLLTGKAGIANGDRANVVRTELYKRFAPMKVYPGEKNFNPHYMHLQISKDYDFVVLNECLKIVDYQNDGMSTSMLWQYWNSPNSFMDTRLLYLSFPNSPLGFRLKNTIHLVSSALLSNRLNEAFAKTEQKFIFLLAYLPGAMLSFYIKLKNRGRE